MKPWSVEECEAYAKQLRDKTRANTAEHAAQAIEYLLGLVKREWVGLTDEEIYTILKSGDVAEHDAWNGRWYVLPFSFAQAIETKLKEKNHG